MPVKTIGSEYFVHDRDAQTLRGEKTGLILGFGQRVLVRLTDATPMTGGLTLDLLEVEGRKLPQRPAGRSSAGSGRRKLVKRRTKAKKLKKKLARKR